MKLKEKKLCVGIWHRVKPLLLCVATEWSLALHKSLGFGVFFVKFELFI